MPQRDHYQRVIDAPILHISVAQSVDRSGATFTVFCERPGRSGHFSRDWTNAAGQLTPDQAADISGWVARTVTDALVVFSGIQGVLET